MANSSQWINGGSKARWCLHAAITGVGRDLQEGGKVQVLMRFLRLCCARVWWACQYLQIYFGYLKSIKKSLFL
ncbi:MAG: hypothetical protein PHE74_06545 [Comamonas sp.]|nr:hypothetical protein [Comamonas sp.]